MEIQSQPVPNAMPDVQQAAPPPPEPDSRAPAIAAASAKDPRPEVPLPIPASPSQTGLVSKAALPDKEAVPTLDASGVSEAERSLKPYGISMLPDRPDAASEKAPPKA